MDVDLEGALVVLDEAHNVEDTAREDASCDVALRDVVLAADEFARVAVAVRAGGGDDAAGGSTTPSDAAGGSTTPSSGRPVHFGGGDFDFSGGDPSVDPFRLLAEVTGSVARWLAGASDRSNPRCPLRARGFEQWQATWSGRDAVAGRMRDAGLAPERVDLAREAVKRLTKEANDAKTPASRRVAGHALKTAEVLLTSAAYARGAGAEDYRLVVRSSLKAGAADEEAAGFDEASETTLSLWAMNPALAFGDVTRAARCVVLTSGTLAPLDSFASELGASFPIRAEAPHCVDAERQVWAGSVRVGPTGARLSGTYKCASELAYQDDLGNALERWCEEIPHGALMFFPSYAALERVAERWRRTGAWRRIERTTGKRIFQEPRNNGKEAGARGGGRGGRGRGGRGGGRGGGGGGASSSSSSPLDQLLAKYYRCVKNSARAAPHANAPAPRGSASRGAVLLAVCRGKVSEGIDFSDANARAVIVVGIPYPNVKDARVELKRRYNDDGARTRGLLTGDRWYSQQAFRALNQAVGRCLRHRNDHGAIILADERYGGTSGDQGGGPGGAGLARHLPKWLRPSLRECASFEESVAGLRAFFRARSAERPPEKPPAETLANALRNERAKKERAEANGEEAKRPPRAPPKALDATGPGIKHFFAPRTRDDPDRASSPPPRTHPSLVSPSPLEEELERAATGSAAGSTTCELRRDVGWASRRSRRRPAGPKRRTRGGRRAADVRVDSARSSAARPPPDRSVGRAADTQVMSRGAR